MVYLKKANLDDAKKEWGLAQKIPREENGFENQAQGMTYEEFVGRQLPEWTAREKGESLPEGYVPDTHYFLWDDDKCVGMFSLRHYLNDFLRQGPGHIGYGVAPEYRGRGYATEGLRLMIEEARKLPIDTDEIYLSVNKDNPASLRVMEKNGGYVVGETETEHLVRIKL